VVGLFWPGRGLAIEKYLQGVELSLSASPACGFVCLHSGWAPRPDTRPWHPRVDYTPTISRLVGDHAVFTHAVVFAT
jgi:hypothetical protein